MTQDDVRARCGPPARVEDHEDGFETVKACWTYRETLDPQTWSVAKVSFDSQGLAVKVEGWTLVCNGSVVGTPRTTVVELRKALNWPSLDERGWSRRVLEDGSILDVSRGDCFYFRLIRR